MSRAPALVRFRVMVDRFAASMDQALLELIIRKHPRINGDQCGCGYAGHYGTHLDGEFKAAFEGRPPKAALTADPEADA